MATDQPLLTKAVEILDKMTDNQRDLAAHYLLGRLRRDLNENDLAHLDGIMETYQ